MVVKMISFKKRMQIFEGFLNPSRQQLMKKYDQLRNQFLDITEKYGKETNSEIKKKLFIKADKLRNQLSKISIKVSKI